MQNHKLKRNQYLRITAILLAGISLAVYAYGLSVASYTAYPPLSVLIQSGSIPAWIVWIYTILPIFALLALILYFFYKQQFSWLKLLGLLFMVLFILD